MLDVHKQPEQCEQNHLLPCDSFSAYHMETMRNEVSPDVNLPVVQEQKNPVIFKDIDEQSG